VAGWRAKIWGFEVPGLIARGISILFRVSGFRAQSKEDVKINISLALAILKYPLFRVQS